MPSPRTCGLILAGFLALAAPARTETGILARTDVPNTVLKQSEVRLVLRNEDTVVQTILHTRFQNLVKKRITSNERKHWPDSQEATRYLAALEQALEQYASRKRQAQGPLGLVIDFVDGIESDRVDFSFVSVSPGRDGYIVGQAVLWRSLGLSQEYIRRNQEYIVVDVFGKEAADVLGKLKDLRLSQGRVHE